MKYIAVALPVLLAGACARGTPDGASQAGTATQTVTQPEVPIGCLPSPGSQPLAERTSPYDSVKINIGGQIAQICYSRPAAKGRTVFGGLVPYDRLWRTGANEPTILNLPVAVEIAGVRVEPGSYSVYTVPGEESWSIIVNRATKQWGHESTYTPEIQAQEVGRGTVPVERMDSQVEQFTIRTEPATAGVMLVMEWERTRVRIPLRAVSQ